MQLAADVGRRDHVGSITAQGFDLARRQPAAEVRLQYRIGAGGAAAQMGLRRFGEVETGPPQYALDQIRLAKAVVERTRHVHGDPFRGRRGQQVEVFGRPAK